MARTRPWIRHALLLAIVAAAVFALVGYWGRMRAEAEDLSALSLLGAGGLALAGLWTSMLAWRAVLRDLGSPLGLAAGSRLFFVAQLAKYVPGGVWPVAAHMELGRDHAIRRHRTATAFAVMSAMSVLTAVVVGAAILPLAAGDRALEYAPLLVVLPLLAWLLHPRVLTRVLEWTLRRLGREPPERGPSLRGILVATAWLSAMWLCFGAHTWLIAHDLGGDGATLAPLSLGAFAVSWAAGFLFVVAPAGLGVRDAALVVLLGGALGTSGAAVLAVASRLLLTAADLVLAAGAVAFGREGADG